MLEKKGFYIIFSVILAVVIFYASSLSSIPGAPKTLDLSVFYHFLIFFYFSFFLLLAISGSKKIKLKHIVLTLIISLIYAASDEFHQLFVPGRACTLSDFLTDSAGVLFSILLILSLTINKTKKNK
jgi:VanZ family protein